MKEPAFIRRLRAQGIRVSPDGKISARAGARALEKLQNEYWDLMADYHMLKDHLAAEGHPCGVLVPRDPESRPDGVRFE